MMSAPATSAPPACDAKLRLSVALCTHNPRRDYLDRTVAALQKQTLSQTQWEFLLIDNASSVRPVEKRDWQWHGNGQLLVESVLGLTHARLCAMSGARADILVFVDDDNILNDDYLVQALNISEAWPCLGVWGGGIEPEFDEAPADWTRPYWTSLAVRTVDRPKWTNQATTPDMVPYGAGLCIRRRVWENYSAAVRTSPQRLALGRTGTSLASAEDVDLYLEALELGLGAGLFPELHMRHLIPPSRLQPENLLRLVEANHYCLTLLRYLRNPGTAAHSSGWKTKFKSFVTRLWGRIRLLSGPAFERQFRLAWDHGVRRAEADARDLMNQSPPAGNNHSQKAAISGEKESLHV